MYTCVLPRAYLCLLSTLAVSRQADAALLSRSVREDAGVDVQVWSTQAGALAIPYVCLCL